MQSTHITTKLAMRPRRQLSHILGCRVSEQAAVETGGTRLRPKSSCVGCRSGGDCGRWFAVCGACGTKRNILLQPLLSPPLSCGWRLAHTTHGCPVSGDASALQALREQNLFARQ
ncbi:hypothetical protein NDU88_005153 [Pleurodeles waltl]|uniref:Uncharacterized protein n=1 Tax=Pleurodeles waltl TaxID=8319 RepID=A0AAV7TTY5_PLEWA|nr:hypothetical protein NDU88_005153 [Pleurodeles waltl]